MGGRRRLPSGVPRAYRDHRRRAGVDYRVYVTAIIERLGRLPTAAFPTLREAGIVNGELERLHAEAEDLQERPRRRRDLQRVQRRRIALRSQLVALERRLEELAAPNGHGQDLASLVTAAHKDAKR